MNSYYQVHSYRYQRLLTAITQLQLPPGAKVLDLGCYPPHLFNSLRRLGFDTYGVSSGHEKVHHPQVLSLNLETDVLAFKPNSYHLVILTEVLEHLTTSPRHLFSQVRRLLKPGGYFLITTPNVLRFQNIINLLLGHNIYYPLFQLSQNIYHRHNREYTLADLLLLISQSHFSISTTKHIISYPPFRQKNKNDSFPLKLVKYLNYGLMLLFPSRRDTIYLLAQKP